MSLVKEEREWTPAIPFPLCCRRRGSLLAEALGFTPEGAPPCEQWASGEREKKEARENLACAIVVLTVLPF